MLGIPGAALPASPPDSFCTGLLLLLPEKVCWSFLVGWSFTEENDWGGSLFVVVLFFSLDISHNEEEYHYMSLLNSALMFLKFLILDSL